MFGQKCTLLGSLILSYCVCTLYEMKGQLTLFESYRNTPAELSIYEILTATYLYFFNNSKARKVIPRYNFYLICYNVLK